VKNLFSFLFILIFSGFAFGQAKQDKYGSETFEEGKQGAVPNFRPEKQTLLTILKLDNRDIIAGNGCVREETAKMGFEYMVLCNRKITFGNKLWVFFYNFGTKTELTFRNGFGWQRRIKQKIRDCRRKSGDFVW
jgi:hypothetical protein